MSNESKPQEWFYLQNETWNGPFKTSGLKELVKKGLVDPSTLLRIGVASAPIKASQVKSLFPNYQGEEQTAASPIKNKAIPKNAPALIAGAILIAFVLGLLIYSLIKSNGNVPRISLADGISSTAEGVSSIEKEMVLIPAGRFMMGDRGDKLQVTLTKPFYMAKYEVTRKQWNAVMGGNPRWTKGIIMLPVTDVSWEDCQDFIKKLNAKTSGGFRLPTEAEWEYACRAGTTTEYSYGNNLTKSDANIDGDSIKEVGSYKPNAFGLYDMHGNVWEWCEDWYGALQDGELTDPKGPKTGTHRVFRGGSFYDKDWGAISSDRNGFIPSIPNHYSGFRLARIADLKAEATISVVPTPKPAEENSATGNLLVSPFNEAKAKEVQKAVAKSLGKEFEEKEDLGQGIKLDLVLIPAGKFIMGSPANEKGRSTNEKQHEVTITKPYFMGKYEVTQDQWEAVMGDNPSKIKGKKLPVTNASWNDCQEFIRKLNAKAKGGYRLPTESEWEYSCRAGTNTVYSYGDSLTKSDANISGDSTKIVGSYKPNAFGLYDMHGNVWEWCENWYGSLQDGEVTDPKGPATGDARVLRGGSFLSVGSDARSSLRYYNSPSGGGVTFYGFRLARTP